MLIIVIYLNKSNTPNRRSGDNGRYDLTESSGGWEPGRIQLVKWTAEGFEEMAGKCQSIRRRVGIR
ncbi:hypothetical protein [Huintestinicola sp.]|uniref:hypothetical protein n=1 Tax=Huintestinicola sp. TaxID=2981661 RepID=UPI003D7E20A6